MWLPEEIVQKIDSKLLQKFLKALEGQFQEAQLTEENESEVVEDEVLESFRIERVLAIKKSLAFTNKSFQTISEELLGTTTNVNNPVSSYNNYKFLVKWEELDYTRCSWEDQFIATKFPEKLRRYLDRKINPNYPHLSNQNKGLKKLSTLSSRSGVPQKIEKQPDFIQGTLADYQVEGLSWLMNCHHTGTNAVLADETGLGKRVQALSFLKYLSVEAGVNGPFLIVVPTPAISEWHKEVLKWVPNLDVVVYDGDKDSRNYILKLEFLKQSKSKKSRKPHVPRPKFHIAITSYTNANQDFAKLKRVEWEAVFIDEALRLKNADPKIFKVCTDFATKFRLMLTKIPTQHSYDELIGLIKVNCPQKKELIDKLEQFMDALRAKGIIPDTELQKDKELDPDRENALKGFHETLKLFVLKRSAKEVKAVAPDVVETVFRLPLTDAQKGAYRNILVKNFKLLANAESSMAKIATKPRKPGEIVTPRQYLNNLLLNLSLVCAHPEICYGKSNYLFSSLEDFESSLQVTSNKLRFLDRVFPKLAAKGGKIIIFTQFSAMLDLIENYLLKKNCKYHRLDVTTKQSEQDKIIDNFNQGPSAKVLILQAKVGGQGINLSSSDSLIFVDSTYYPYRSIRNFCGNYQIGEKKNIAVYRFVSKLSVEEKIVENAIKRLMIGEQFVQLFEAGPKLSNAALDVILRHGAKELLETSADKMQQEDEYLEEKLTRILSQDVKADEKTIPVKSPDFNDVYLSGIDFVDIKTVTLLETTKSEDTKDNKFWESLLANDYASHATHSKSMEVEPVKATTQRRYIKFNLNKTLTSVIENPDPLDSNDEGADMNGKENGNATGMNGVNPEASKQHENIEESKDELPETLQAVFDSFVEEFNRIQALELQEEQLAEITLGLNEVQRLKFLEFVLKFGMYFLNTEAFYNA